MIASVPAEWRAVVVASVELFVQIVVSSAVLDAVREVVLAAMRKAVFAAASEVASDTERDKARDGGSVVASNTVLAQNMYACVRCPGLVFAVAAQSDAVDEELHLTFV